MENQNTINYKGYIGRVEFDNEENLLHGEVVNMQDPITFKGKSVEELKQSLKDAVDAYLAFCEERGREPEKPFSGQFVVRTSPELHREISTLAKARGISMNQCVIEALQNELTGVTHASLQIPPQGLAFGGFSPVTPPIPIPATGWQYPGAGFPIDVAETDHDFLVKAGVPGVRPEDLEITVNDGILTIRGDFKEPKTIEEKQEYYLLREQPQGQFSRSVAIPAQVKVSQIAATYEAGMLYIKIPKEEGAPRKPIKLAPRYSPRLPLILLRGLKK